MEIISILSKVVWIVIQLHKNIRTWKSMKEIWPKKKILTMAWLGVL